MKWLKKAIGSERQALERARRRFIRRPTEKRLHDVRTAGRRLRSLLDDAASLVPGRKLLCRVKRAAEATDAARDATIVLRLLEANLDGAELASAEPILRELREREVEATALALHRLARTHFAR